MACTLLSTYLTPSSRRHPPLLLHVLFSAPEIYTARTPLHTYHPPSTSPSHRHPPHLLHRPKPPHILRPQIPHLRIQMSPQSLPKPIHNALQLPQIQLLLPALHIRYIPLQLIHALVDAFVVCKHRLVFLKARHFPGEDGEDVLFFDRVVDGEVVAELVAE